MSASDRDPRLRDVVIGILLVVGVGYFGLAYAGPEGGCIPGGADIGFTFPHGASRTVRDVGVAGRDLQRGDEVRVVHRSSRLEPYCIRDVDQETLARTTARTLYPQ